MSDDTIKVHIVKVEREYEDRNEVFDIRGFFNYQKALDFLYELARDMDENVQHDDSEFSVQATHAERAETGLWASFYYVDDVEVEK